MKRLSALAVLLSLPAVARAQTPSKLRIATTPTDSGAEVFYAADRGFFTRAGLDVEVSILNNGAAVAAGVAGGSFDIAQSNVPSLASAYERNLPFVMIAPASIFSIAARPTAGIVVAKGSAIQTARDFSGKTVAVSGLRNIAQVTVQAWIDKNGGDSASVKFVEMPFAAMVPALEQGRIDAAELAEPELDEALRAGDRSLSSGYDAVADQFVIGAWFCTKAFAAAQPDIVRRFTDAMAETARWANAHQNESLQILSKWTKTPVAPTMPRVVYGERLVAAQVQPIIDVSARYHALKAPVPAAELFASFVR